MTLFSICINALAKPEVLEIHKNNLSVIPVSVKNVLLKILCKRGYIKDAYLFKLLVNSDVVVMDLSECIVTDDLLSCLNICKNLQKLDLSLSRRQTRYISNRVLNSLLLFVPHLQSFIIPYCKEVNDEVIKTVCKNCKNLKELHIPESSVTDCGLEYIGKNLYYLSIINILGTQVSDLGIEYLTSGPLSEKLTEINMDKCPKISSHSSIIIAKKCPSIKIFNCGSYAVDEELTLAISGIRSKAKQVFWYV